MNHRSVLALVISLLAPAAGMPAESMSAAGTPADGTPSVRPNVVVVTVDTLRADHLSSYGYHRPTSPNIDRLMADGARFTAARAVQALTSPSMCSMWTSLHPQEHGATRNALRVRDRLGSLSKSLRRNGYHTAAFVSNGVLKAKLSGLDEHFEHFEGVFTRKQWFIIRDEARAEDVTEAALEHLEDHVDDDPGRPVLLWAHYIEPHRPYIFHKEFAERLAIRGKTSIIDSYDTEIAYVDREVGRLLDGVRELVAPSSETLIVFAADHGEGLKQHDEIEHGRHLFETTLNVPLAFVWPGHITPRTIDAPASLLDVGPTTLGLVDLPIPEPFVGFDWTPVFDGAAPPDGRVTYHQAHKLSVLSRPADAGQDSQRKGLLAVGLVGGGRKEVFYVKNGTRLVFDLSRDPAEADDLAGGAAAISDAALSEALLRFMSGVYEGLDALGHIPVDHLDAESVEKLRALGYID